MVQWLTLCPPSAGHLGSVPGWRNKIPHAATKTWCSQINKEKRKKGKKERLCISVIPKLAHVECSWKTGGKKSKKQKPELISLEDLEFRNLCLSFSRDSMTQPGLGPTWGGHIYPWAEEGESK